MKNPPYAGAAAAAGVIVAAAAAGGGGGGGVTVGGGGGGVVFIFPAVAASGCVAKPGALRPGVGIFAAVVGANPFFSSSGALNPTAPFDSSFFTVTKSAGFCGMKVIDFVSPGRAPSSSKSASSVFFFSSLDVGCMSFNCLSNYISDIELASFGAAAPIGMENNPGLEPGFTIPTALRFSDGISIFITCSVFEITFVESW
jgi:hypothetical protein